MGESNFDEYGEFDPDFFSDRFKAGAVWVDFKKGIRQRLLKVLEKVKRDIKTIGRKLLNHKT